MAQRLDLKTPKARNGQIIWVLGSDILESGYLLKPAGDMPREPCTEFTTGTEDMTADLAMLPEFTLDELTITVRKVLGT